ncbi:hypothetical protein [Desmospora profundinema]|uniref:Uncharacterized protein n=1 Tax=Desmospora profundinema TaxID=1571184 RepID=A0ABU1IHJ8_9BACL|nr:hypothetical protein [Desmospora profundinema]MDR6224017.1 hypothetical protein [Desmospora profundinema]
MLSTEFPSDTRFLLFDFETDGEFLSVTVHSAISVSNLHDFPEPGIAGVDLMENLEVDDLGLDEDDVVELEDELIEFGREYYVEWLAKCFDKGGGDNYHLPCVAYLDGGYYHLQKKQWIEPEDI